MDGQKRIIFSSKRDLWLGLVMWGCAAMGLAFSILDCSLFWVILTVIIAIFIGWIWFYTIYIVTGEKLEIRCGPFRQTVSLNEIVRIEKTRDPLAACALSLDRLVIKYGRSGFVLVSPKNKDRLASKNLNPIH